MAARVAAISAAWPSTVPISNAFCCPVLANAAGKPVSASSICISARCAPTLAPPAAASPSRPAASVSRNQSSAAKAGCVRSRPATSSCNTSRAAGKPPAAPSASTAFRRSTSPARAAVAATACRAMLSSRPASQAGSAPPCANSRLRPDIAVSYADTSRAWPGSSAQTRRSRKRRRPEALSWNSRSICGVSQTHAQAFATSAWLRGAAPSRRNTRRSAGPSGGEPVPISRSTPSCVKRPFTPQRPGAPGPRRASSPRRAPRNPRPGASRETASSRLVLPEPLGPVMTAMRRRGRHVRAW